MIEIGKNFLWDLSRAKQAQHARKQQAQAAAAQATQDMREAAQQHAQQMAYLFRSAAEQTQLAYERAREQLATLQAKRAAQGLGASSSVPQLHNAALQQALQETRTQQQLQTAAATQAANFRQKWKEFLSYLAKVRKQAKQKNRLGSVGQAFKNLFQ